VRKKYKFYILLILACLILIFFGFFILSHFQLRKIIIISTSHKLDGLEFLAGQNLLTIDVNKTIRNLINKNKTVKSIKMNKLFPDTLLLEVTMRNPRYLVVKDNLVFPVDEEGTILVGANYDENLLKIQVGNLSIFSGEKSDWRILKAIDLLKNMENQSILIDQIFIEDKGSLFLLDLSSKTKVVIPYNLDAAFVATSLQVIMSRFRIEGKFVNKIDFRFEKPVVTLSSGEKMSSL